MRDVKAHPMTMIRKCEEYFSTTEPTKKKELADKIRHTVFDCRDYSRIPEWSKKVCGIDPNDNSKVPKDVADVIGYELIPSGHDDEKDIDYEIRRFHKRLKQLWTRQGYSEF